MDAIGECSLHSTVCWKLRRNADKVQTIVSFQRLLFRLRDQHTVLCAAFSTVSRLRRRRRRKRRRKEKVQRVQNDARNSFLKQLPIYTVRRCQTVKNRNHRTMKVQAKKILVWLELQRVPAVNIWLIRELVHWAPAAVAEIWAMKNRKLIERLVVLEQRQFQRTHQHRRQQWVTTEAVNRRTWSLHLFIRAFSILFLHVNKLPDLR